MIQVRRLMLIVFHRCWISRLRSPVVASRTSMTMAQQPGDRSRMCPFISIPRADKKQELRRT
jgi:hypothetical protein